VTVTFTFERDGVSAYGFFFFRDGSDLNRPRLNALRLELIPEPGLPAPLALGGFVLGLPRRRPVSAA
jgi:hypothetical protein